MSEIKIAILRTFETTVKALLTNNLNTSLFDTDESIGFGQICDHLQSIKHELSEVKTRLQHIEQRQCQNVVVENAESSIWFDNKCRSIEQSEVSADEELEHDLRMALSAPIPLKTVQEEVVIQEQKKEQEDKRAGIDQRPVTPPVLPEILPNLADDADDDTPDIEDDDVHAPPSTPTATDINADADCEDEDDNADDDDADDADVDTSDTKDQDDTNADGSEEDDEDEEEAGDADDEDDGDAEEEGLEELTFKGKTYYKDSDNLVYILNADGEVNEDPVGRWNEAMSVVRFFAKTVA
jgi:hypothetical protein